MTSAAPRKPHRAYFVFGGLCLFFFAAFGLLFSGFGLFLAPMSEDLGIPYVQISVTSTIRVLCGMVTTAFLSVIAGKIRLRYVISVGSLLLAGVLLLISRSDSMAQFIPLFIVLGLLCGLTAYGIVPVILNQWFLAPGPWITVAMAVGGLGAVVLCPVVSSVITAWGWRAGYRVMAAIVVAVMVPIGFFLLDHKPAERGLEPLDNRRPGRAGAQTEPEPEGDGRVGVPLLILCLAFFLISALTGGMYVHISSFLQFEGFGPAAVAALVSAFQAGATVFQLVPGLLVGRFGLRTVLFVSIPLVILGTAALLFLGAGSAAAAGVAVFLLGGSRMFTSMNSVLLRGVTDRSAFGRLYPRLHAAFLAGTASTGVVYGAVYSATESYDGVLFLIIGSMAILLALLCAILRKAKTSNK